MKIISLFLAIFPNEIGVTRIELKPFDFQNEARPDSLISGMLQLDTDGTNLFLIPNGSPTILEISLEKGFLRMYGGPGQGPGMLGSHQPKSISAQKGRFWTLDSQMFAQYFEDGNHIIKWPVKSYNIARSRWGAKTMAFNRDHVVIPVHPLTRHLAAAYDYGGNRVKYLGEIYPIDHEMLMKNPGLNDTHWAQDEDFWYCLFKYWPRLLVFDQDFKMIRDIELRGPEIDIAQGIYHGDIPDIYEGPPLAWFPGLAAQDGYLYFSCRDALYKVSAKDFKTVSRFKFFSELFVREHDPNPNLKLIELFTVIGDHAVLGWSHLPYDHDLWIADIP